MQQKVMFIPYYIWANFIQPKKYKKIVDNKKLMWYSILTSLCGFFLRAQKMG